MENNEGNIKPQSTGGLKLMTVFIAVLALHVLVIGGVTVYHLMSGGSTDTDLTDGKSKDAKVSADGSVALDNSSSDSSQTDKTTVTETTPATPAIEQTPPAETATTPAPAPAVATSTPSASTPTGPVVTPPQASAPTPISAVAMQTTEQAEPMTAPPLETDGQPAPVSTGTYVVKMNDTIEKIAHRHHTTVAKLKTANDLNGELLHVGQHLIIPGKTEVAAVPVSDTTSTTSTTILSGSPAGTPDEAPAAPAPREASAGTSHHTYTVVKGDTLSKIAHKFKTTTKALMAANNITDPSKLSIGKKLMIPSHQAHSTATATTAVRQAPAPASTPTVVQPTQTETKTTGQLANFVQ